MAEFAASVRRHAKAHESLVKAACGAATFSWYIGIGEGLGASPDGRRAGEPVSSNLSPALGRDAQGLPGAILSYAHMPHANMPAGAPLDLRVARRLVQGPDGTDRLAALLRSFVETGGSMLTLTVADTEELRAAQRDPDRHKSLRVRMGGWMRLLHHAQPPAAGPPHPPPGAAKMRWTTRRVVPPGSEPCPKA